MPINSTTSFDFAIFLAATYKEDHDLKLLGVQPVEPGSEKLKFCFEDKNNAMPEMERIFLEGGKAPALAMMATLRRIRKLMELTKAQQGNPTLERNS